MSPKTVTREIMGVFDHDAKMIPVQLTVHGGSVTRSFNYESAEQSAYQARLAMMARLSTPCSGLKRVWRSSQLRR